MDTANVSRGRRGHGAIENGPALLQKQLDDLARRKAALASIACPHRRRVESLAIDQEMEDLRRSHRVLGKILALRRGRGVP